jgi:hypothetical protein
VFGYADRGCSELTGGSAGRGDVCPLLAAVERAEHVTGWPFVASLKPLNATYAIR